MTSKVESRLRTNRFEIIIFMFIIFLMIVSPNNHNLKGLIKAFGISSCLVIILIAMKKVYSDIEDRLIYLLGFMIPFTTIISEPKNPNNILLAGSKSYFTITVYDCIILFLIIAYLRRNNFKPIIKNKRIMVLPILYLFINFISIFFSINKGIASIEFFRVLKMVLLFVYIIENFGKKEYMIFIKGLAMATIFQLVIGLIQLIKQDSVGLYFLGESRSVFRASVTGLEKGISGTLRHPGTLAVFSLFSLNMLLYSNKEKIKMRNIAVISSICIIFLTFSRTVILLSIGSILLFGIYNLILKGKYKIKRGYKILRKDFLRKHSMLIALSAIVIVIFLSFITKRFIDSDLMHQFNSRGEHTRIALNIYEKNGRKMSGANNYTIAASKAFPLEYSKGSFRYKQPVHNLYVLYLVELGIFGVIIYILMNLSVIRRLVTTKFNPNVEMYRCLCGTTAWTVVLLLYNFTGWSGAKDQITLIMWISFGLSYAAFKNLKSNGVDLR